MTDKQRETAIKKLQEGAHFHCSSDMNADMSTEAADMVVLAVDKYIPTQNWEVRKWVEKTDSPTYGRRVLGCWLCKLWFAKLLLVCCSSVRRSEVVNHSL